MTEGKMGEHAPKAEHASVINELEQSEPSAYTYLIALSGLSPNTPIPFEWVASCGGEEIVDTLVDRGFIHASPDKKKLFHGNDLAPRMSSVVEPKTMKEAAQNFLAAQEVGPPASHENWPTYRLLLHHLVASDAVQSQDPKIRGLWRDTYIAVSASGSPDIALELAEEAREAWEGYDRMQVTWHVGTFLRKVGDADKALELHQELCEESITLEPNPVLRDVYRNAVALDLKALGRRHEAHAIHEEIGRKAWESLENDPTGPDAGLHVAALSCWGDANKIVGRYSEALEIHTKAVEIRKNLPNQGPNHRFTLAEQTQVAICLRETGEVDAAQVMLDENLAQLERTVGYKHPDAIAAKTELGRTIIKAGNIERGLLCLKFAFKQQQSVDPESPLMLTVAHAYTEELNKLGLLGSWFR